MLNEEQEYRKTWLADQKQITNQVVKSSIETFRDLTVNHIESVTGEFHGLLNDTREAFTDAVHESMKSASEDMVK